jgi:hypothetical protein
MSTLKLGLCETNHFLSGLYEGPPLESLFSPRLPSRASQNFSSEESAFQTLWHDSSSAVELSPLFSAQSWLAAGLGDSVLKIINVQVMIKWDEEE